MVKYIYAGYSKCGTKTIATAFRKLGFKVCDYEEFAIYCAEEFIKFEFSPTTLKEKQEILYKCLKDFDIVTDLPFHLYWKELLEVFPDAKVIYYEREIESWFKSFKHTIDIVCSSRTSHDFIHDTMVHLIFPFAKNHLRLYKYYTGIFFGQHVGLFKNLNGQIYQLSEMHAKRVYRQHNADIKVNCPKEKLIILPSLSLTFQKLCDLIDIELPSHCKGMDWPHVNKKSSYIISLVSAAFVDYNRPEGDEMATDNIIYEAVRRDIKNFRNKILGIFVVILAIVLWFFISSK